VFRFRRFQVVEQRRLLHKVSPYKLNQRFDFKLKCLIVIANITFLNFKPGCNVLEVAQRAMLSVVPTLGL